MPLKRMSPPKKRQLQSRTSKAVRWPETQSIAPGKQGKRERKKRVVPFVGIELTTYRLQGDCSTTELKRRSWSLLDDLKMANFAFAF